MKAVFQTKYGPCENLKLREIDKPVPGVNEVLIKVRAASVHPDVWHVAAGRPWILRLMGAGFRAPKNPVPGTDMAGVIETVGKNVDTFKPGDAVFGETIGKMQWVNGGAYAEYVSVTQSNLMPKPENVSFEQAASVPTAGYIVLMNLQSVNQIQPGDKVLVNGAGGGVGSIALQIAKAHGAHVTAVDHRNKLELLRELGADELIDYTQNDFTRVANQYDLIFDVPGNHPFRKCRRALKPEGKYILIGHEHFGQGGRRIFGLIPHFFVMMFVSPFIKQLPKPVVTMPPKADVMKVLKELLESGNLSPVIDKVFPLKETARAIRYLQSGQALGRIVIKP